jgi:hypothetical protein
MNFDRILENDLDWRTAELKSVGLVAQNLDKKQLAYSGMLRGLWVLLYAHFEGFCKFAWDSFIDELCILCNERGSHNESLIKTS